MSPSKPLSSLLCSIQRALLWNVTPNLRAVNAFIEGEIYGIIFYYDKPPSEDEEELASLTDTGFISDFPDDETTCTIEVIPYPKAIPQKGYCVYQRYEKDIDEQQSLIRWLRNKFNTFGRNAERKPWK